VAALPNLALLALMVAMSTASPEEKRTEDAIDISADPSLSAIRHRKMDEVVRIAVLEAHRRLESPRCREIFSGFRDLAGRPLQENLDSLGLTGQGYLAWLLFVDAGFQGRCGGGDVLAYTVPGSRVVYYCGRRFARKIKEGRLGLLAVLVLHEELHSLGLGENPPGPDEITREVEARCGP
jgi:hypothetical protein